VPENIVVRARCVQSFNDSQKSAIHIKYRGLLRSSSKLEPSHPSVTVIMIFIGGELPAARICLKSVWQIIARQKYFFDPPKVWKKAGIKIP